MKNYLVILLLSLLSSSLFADTSFCSKKELEVLPILQGGRVKPLYVHASETMKNLIGKSKVGNLSAVEAYCLLSLHSLGLPSDVPMSARIDHVDLLKFLGMGKDQHFISYEQLINKMEDLKTEAQANSKNNESYVTAISKLYGSIATYQEIKSGQDWMLALNVNNTIAWQPVVNVLSNKAADPFTTLMQTKTAYDQSSTKAKYEMELFYAKAGLAHWALLMCILALGSLVLFKNFNITLGFSSMAVILQLIHITLRTIISGRAPITNMYETVLFSGFGGLVLCLFYYFLKKEKLYVYIGLAYNVCTLMMLSFAHGMLSATISPLVPVLRDNFWLSTHVTTIILSYGALALSWILANTVLIRKKWGKITKQEIATSADIIYTTLKWGTTLLAAGIILGGVWADYSWGRFWGWDPKETWSLIVLCIYMAILHGRYTSWIKVDRFILVTAGAFMSVMMAWFGVNYILASGLHSYGFSAGGAVFLFSFFALQTAVMIVTTLKTKEIEAN